MQFDNYDLHSHSSVSDGVLSPTELLQQAKQRGLRYFALTDHDTVEGVLQLRSEVVTDITLINGTELTCSWQNRVIHVVGLDLDITDESLLSYFSKLSDLRLKRAEQISARLEKAGLPRLLELAMDAAKGGVVGRPHFAKVMHREELVSSEQQAFSKYLGTGKCADVKVNWPDYEEAIAIINKASGLAVLAHPTKYKMTFTKLRSVIKDFADAGGRAIEVSYPGVTPDHQNQLIRVANNLGLLISAGSDFHSPAYNWTALGKFPPIKFDGEHVLSEILVN